MAEFIINTATICTRRLVIEDFQVCDISSEYLSWLNDSVLMEHSSQRDLFHTSETARTYLDTFVPGKSRFVALWLGATRELVGTATMYWHREHNAVDVGMLVGKSGEGYGKEAFCAITSHLLAAGAPKVTAGTASENARMISLAHAAGMREAVRLDGEPNTLYFEATAEA